MVRILTKRERVVLYIAIGIVMLSLGFHLVVAPVLQKNELLNQEINISKIKLKKYAWLLSQKDYIQNKYNSVAFNLNLADSEKDAIVGLLSKLENFAQGSNIRIIDIRPQSYTNIEASPGFQIDLRTEGTIENYLKFIHTIQNSPLLLKIRRVQLRIKPNTQVLEGSFSISQFSF